MYSYQNCTLPLKFDCKFTLQKEISSLGIIQETLIYIVCLFFELTTNNFPFFTKDLNFTTPCVPKSSTRPPLSPLREHLRRFSVITISSFHTNVFKY